MRNVGIVTELNNDMATIKVMRTSACGENCASCKGGCSNSGTYIEAINTVGAGIGDKVIAAVPDNAALTAAFVAYLIPLAMAIIAAVVFYVLGYGDAVLFFAAILGLLLGNAAAKVISVRFKNIFSVSVIKILSKDEK